MTEKNRESCAQIVDRQKSLAMSAQFAWGFVVGIVACVGCGSKNDRLEISGTVTLNKSSLDSGSIRFTSVGLEKLMAAGAEIQQGAYRIPQAKGLLPGTYHVEINSPDADAPQVMLRATPGGPAVPTTPERIPPEYNVESKQTIEVTNDGENHFAFDIVSRPTK